MKLEEAIKHCEEVAILNENTCKAKPDSNLKKYKKCAEEHRQLAEWLKDYKRLLDQQPCEDCVSRKQAQTEIELSASRYTLAKERGSMGKVEWSDSLIKVSDVADIIRNLPPVIPKGVTVTDFADKCRECGKMRITCKTVTLTPFEIKMMQMSLYHQWFRMTDDNGEAINCEQKSADCVFDLMNRFEKLRAEVEQEEKE